MSARLRAGDVITVSEAQAHHLQHVLRLGVGATVRLFSETGGEFRGTIASAAKKAVTIAVGDNLRQPAPMADLWLCPAPIQKARFDLMIEKSVELGVGEIQPILTERTQVRAVNADRLYKICVEAAEQSERLSVPAVGLLVSLDDFIAVFPKDRLALVCAEHGDAMPIQAALQTEAVRALPRAAIVTGPEGGFTGAELDKLRDMPNACLIRLGPRILRAETAAIAALACWQAARGDWPSAG